MRLTSTGGVSRYRPATSSSLAATPWSTLGTNANPILTPTTNSLALDDRGYIRTDPATEERRAERL